MSPRGPRSEDVALPGCEALPPPFPALSAAARADLQAMLTGAAIPSSGLCAGAPRGGTLARGYVTVDVTRRCTTLDPTRAGYFGPDGVALGDNVLAGDFMLVDTATNSTHGFSAVHLEAGTLPAGAPSFYTRYGETPGLDGREPLPSAFGVRFAGALFAGAAELVAWRESPAAIGASACGAAPPWVPLSTPAIHLVDEATAVTTVAASLPVAVGVLDVATDLASPSAEGLALLDLDHGGFAGRRAQAFVVARREGGGRFDEEATASLLDDPCTGERSLPWPLFADSFEAGLGRWSGRAGALAVAAATP